MADKAPNKAIINPGGKVARRLYVAPGERFIQDAGWSLIPIEEAAGLEDAPPQTDESGFLVMPENFRLEDTPEAEVKFTVLWVRHDTILNSQPNDPVSFLDQAGQKRTVTFARWAQIMQQYAVHIAGLTP